MLACYLDPSLSLSLSLLSRSSASNRRPCILSDRRFFTRYGDMFVHPELCVHLMGQVQANNYSPCDVSCVRYRVVRLSFLSHITQQLEVRCRALPPRKRTPLWGYIRCPRPAMLIRYDFSFLRSLSPLSPSISMFQRLGSSWV